MRWMEVKGNKTLKGNVTIPGSKNSSLALIAACCLSEEPVILKNMPNISDIRLVCEIGEDIGLQVKKVHNELYVNPKNLSSADIDLDKSTSYRASYYFIGALLSRFHRVTIGYPGGDNFGERPIDQHVKGLKALGASFTFYEDHYVVEAKELHGADIYFDMITSGATMNVLLAAVKAEGRTILRNAARDPEIVDVAVLLSQMGAKIKGAGTSTITIDGVEGLTGCVHTAIPDRIIAGSLLMGAGISKGVVKVVDVIPEHLLPCTMKLEEAGLDITSGNDYIKATYNKQLSGIRLKTSMYPGFGTDWQQPITAMLIDAESHSAIEDNIYPGRFNHCIQLNRMGADIIMRQGSVVVPGNRQLKGTWVHASDVRAGICLILAGIGAEGVTCITGIEHIERGYPDVVDTFNSLGAQIKLYEDNSILGEEVYFLQKNAVK